MTNLIRTILITISLLTVSLTTQAITPPTKQQKEKYQRDGTWKKRVEAAKALGNQKVHPALVKRAQLKLKKHVLKQHGATSDIVEQNVNAKTLNSDPLPSSMPSKGDVNVLVLLVEFENFPRTEANTVEYMQETIFGDGNSEDMPYDSLTNYYRRSSFDQLNIKGNVLDWYKPDYPRTDNISAQDLIKEILNYHDQKGHDFTQYDNNNDGVIDYFAVIWSGEIGEWASLWWGWKSTFWDPEYTIDGLTLGDYSWQWESSDYPEGRFNNEVLIHETGHVI